MSRYARYATAASQISCAPASVSDTAPPMPWLRVSADATAALASSPSSRFEAAASTTLIRSPSLAPEGSEAHYPARDLPDDLGNYGTRTDKFARAERGQRAARGKRATHRPPSRHGGETAAAPVSSDRSRRTYYCLPATASWAVIGTWCERPRRMARKSRPLAWRSFGVEGDGDFLVTAPLFDAASLTECLPVGAGAWLFENEREAPWPKVFTGDDVSFGREERDVCGQVDPREEPDNESERAVGVAGGSEDVVDVVAADELQQLITDRGGSCATAYVAPGHHPSREQAETHPEETEVEGGREQDRRQLPRGTELRADGRKRPEHRCCQSAATKEKKEKKCPAARANEVRPAIEG